MNRMGSSCSRDASFRDRDGNVFSSNVDQRPFERSDSTRSCGRRSLRHSVVSAIPDDSISTLYPVEDNYIVEADGTRSPKSLADLATDALCRSLPLLNGELPPGLPQDVVDGIVQSLIGHSALNATTLRIFKNCELGALCLAGCRGVSDDWLEALMTTTTTKTTNTNPPDVTEIVDTMEEEEESDEDEEREDHSHNSKRPDLLYGSFDNAHAAYEDLSACSTSSFVSARSNQYAEAPEDHPMIEASSKSSRGVSGGIMSIGDFNNNMHADHDHDEEGVVPLTACWSSCVTSNLTLLDLRGSQNLTDRGLLQLTDLTQLEVARLDNCHSLVGYGLLALSSSHRLHTLSMANCRRLTDEAVITISHLIGMEALSLDGCRCLTNRSMTALADMYSLRKLGLSQCDLLTDEGMKQLKSLQLLEELSLGWCRQISDQGIDALTLQEGRSSRLRILRLARIPITDDGVAHLARLLALEELDLSGCSRVGSAALGKTLQLLKHMTVLDVSYCPGILRSGFQAKINSLKTLELGYSGVKDTHLGKLTHLPALEELRLDSCPVGDWSVAHLADNNVVPKLRSLDLADTDLTDAGMPKIAMFQNLTRLSLFYCNITNGGLRHIAKLKELEVLNLDSREISDVGLRHLQQLRNLKSLDIFSGRITDAGCVYIAAISSLESLELCGGGVGDQGCQALAKLDNLTSLNLSQNERITNRGAAALAALTNLKMLNLSNTRVNSAALRYFGGLVKLQSLSLYGCRGMDNYDGLEKLQNELPNLKCLKLNRATDQDGVVLTDGSSDDDSDWSDNGQRGSEEMDDIDVYSDHD